MKVITILLAIILILVVSLIYLMIKYRKESKEVDQLYSEKAEWLHMNEV